MDRTHQGGLTVPRNAEMDRRGKDLRFSAISMPPRCWETFLSIYFLCSGSRTVLVLLSRHRITFQPTCDLQAFMRHHLTCFTEVKDVQLSTNKEVVQEGTWTMFTYSMRKSLGTNLKFMMCASGHMIYPISTVFRYFSRIISSSLCGCPSRVFVAKKNTSKKSGAMMH